MRVRKNNLRIAVYMRVASEAQDENARLAMEQQRVMLEKLTEKCGNTVIGYFQDYASGIHYDRPGLCAALEAVKNGQADALLAKDYARLGRDPFVTAEIVRQLRAEGKSVYFADALMQGGVL